MPSKKSVTALRPSLKRKRPLVFPRDTRTMPPLFVAKATRQIDRMLPTRHHERLRKYFETYGCLHCSLKRVVYGANGFCSNCISAIGKRLRKIDKLLKASYSTRLRDEDVRGAYLKPYLSARKLLADLVPKSRKPDPQLPYAVYLRPRAHPEGWTE